MRGVWQRSSPERWRISRSHRQWSGGAVGDVGEREGGRIVKGAGQAHCGRWVAGSFRTNSRCSREAGASGLRVDWRQEVMCVVHIVASLC